MIITIIIIISHLKLHEYIYKKNKTKKTDIVIR